MINVDGTGLTNISNNTFDEEDPSWQRIAPPAPTTTTTTPVVPITPAFTG